MKFNLKNLFAILMIVGVSSTFFAQTKVDNYDQGFRIGIGINAGAPFEKPYDFNLGADARLQYDLSKKYSLTITSGYNNLFVDGDNNDLGYIPAKVGFKAFVIEDQFYLMGEAGAAIAVTNSYNKTSLLVSPSIGYATKYIDFSLRYEFLPDFPRLNNSNNQVNGINQVSLRLAYGFAL